jgi:transcriptional regulator GlxA family with amidase domain
VVSSYRCTVCIEECNDADLVYFSSGPGTRDLIKDAGFLSKLRLDPNEQIVCSMCSGALVLAALGILDGITATTYPTAVDELRNFGVEVEMSKHLVTHGKIGTAAGFLAAVDLMGWAIEMLYDSSVRRDVIASVLPVGQGRACIY